MRTLALGLVVTSFLALAFVACHEPAGPAPPPPHRLAPLRAMGAGAVHERDAGVDAEPPRAAWRGPITVGLVVDQLSAWVMSERLAALPSSGGFARLAREGTRVTRMEYAHAVTDTAPGHAALYTGKTPRETGIFGNEIFEGATRVSILRDRDAKQVTPGGNTGRASSSPRVLAVPTVSEAWLAANPSGRLVSLSWKDRGAILPAGHVKDRATVLWFDANEDTWVTSTAFTNEMPAFVKREIEAHPARSFRTGKWTPLDPAWLAAHAKTADDAPGEGDLEGLGVRFDHAVASAKAMRATPFSDLMLLSMAEAALDDLAQSGGPAMLLVSLSANDYVGHVFGPESHEAWDELLRLDGALARLFASLDARVGPDGWSAVLSADHGNVPLPEALAARAKTCKLQDSFERPCAGVRLLPDELGARLHAAEPAVVGICDPWVFVSDEAKKDPKKLEAVEKKVQAMLAREPGVARTYTSRYLAKECVGSQKRDDVLQRICASNGANAGAIYVAVKPGAFFDPLQVIGKGMSHGSPYAYDRLVPLFVRSPGKMKAGQVVEGPVPFTAFRAAVEGATGLGPMPALDTKVP